MPIPYTQSKVGKDNDISLLTVLPKFCASRCGYTNRANIGWV